MSKILNPQHRRMLQYLIDGGEYGTEDLAIQALLDKAFRLGDVRGAVVRSLFSLGWSKEDIMKIQFIFPGSPENTKRTINIVANMVEGLAEKENDV